jgi:branched-chain amino acid transport system ATP-binding protein
MLTIQGLYKSFDGFMAVAEAHLEVRQGEIVAVIGPNGAGKTTLFHLITGQLTPDRGTIAFKGQNIAGLAPYKICRKGISRSYQVVNIFNRLTVFENVQVAVLARRKKTFDLFSTSKTMAVGETEAILASVGLAEQARRISGSLSHGDQKVLEIAVALGNRPELLILDEPTAGMSPEETEATLTLLRHLSTEMGLTLLFCEHDIDLVFSLAHRIMVMQQGATLIQDTIAVVKCDSRVQAAYLGGSATC